jgi:hypothetical protein
LRGSIVEKQRAVPVLTFDHYGTPKSSQLATATFATVGKPA